MSKKFEVYVDCARVGKEGRTLEKVIVSANCIGEAEDIVDWKIFNREIKKNKEEYDFSIWEIKEKVA